MREDLNNWHKLREQLVNDWHMSKADKQELLKLNQMILEECSMIKNNHFLKK